MSKKPLADKLVLRMPNGMRRQLLDITAESHRSLNSEIIYRLEHSMECDQELEEQKQLVKVLSNRLQSLGHSV